MSFNHPIFWHPRADDLENSNLARLLKARNLSYEAFLRWSVENPDEFWRQFFSDCGYRWSKPYTQTLDLSKGIEWADWFVGGETNLCDNAVDRHAQSTADRLAIRSVGENSPVRDITYGQLLDEVSRLAGALQMAGFKLGDAVGLHLPMVAEVAIVLLAVARLGGIVVPLFTGFGAEAISVRLNDAKAKWLFTTDGFLRRGQKIDLLEQARAAAATVPSLERLVVLERIDKIAPQINEISYATFLQTGHAVPAKPFAAATPFMLIYTSGTTGKPKATVHVHAGFPIKAAQDMYHLFDVRQSDLIFWLTDIGWMMGPWLILGGLTLGAAILLYDGAPDVPNRAGLWKLWADHGVSIAGIAPTFVRSIMAYPDAEPHGLDLSKLRIMGSTGEPWNLEPWKWAMEKIGSGRVPIINYSGGTEISGGILGCTTLRPLRPMAFNTVVPGIDADVFSDEGKPVRNQIGNLVIKRANPGLTRGFWNEPDRYLETYWQRFAGVWEHGDLVYASEQGDFYITGRSDDTIKVAGKRLGPAEMESAAVEHPAVREAAAVGISHTVKGQVPVVFIVLKSGINANAALAKELIDFIGEKVGKALKPERVHFISDLPKTRNGKVMRRVVRKVYSNEDPGNLAAIVNPEIIQEIRALALTNNN